MQHPTGSLSSSASSSKRPCAVGNGSNKLEVSTVARVSPTGDATRFKHRSNFMRPAQMVDDMREETCPVVLVMDCSTLRIEVVISYQVYAYWLFVVGSGARCLNHLAKRFSGGYMEFLLIRDLIAFQMIRTQIVRTSQ